ncbi:MAG: hypothetical protein QM665_03780 [Desulfovibrio sp.]
MDVFAPYEQAEQQNQTRQQTHQHAANRAQTFDAAMRAAMDGLMAQPQGRVLLRWMLHLCRNFSAEDVGNAPESCQSSRLFYAEGQRMIGMRLMRLMQQANPGHLPRLLQTKENDAHDLDTF